ncbi:MAG TPA: cyclase family protein [Acidimicrobiales bacterium]|nr:cyclase family protein [Acidimicrobiales bacterium]
MSEVPRYADLPEAPAGGRSGWGVFGPEDSVGMLNLQTPERVAAAARLVRRGALFPLDAPLGMFSPALAATRGVPRHTVLHRAGTIGFDDLYDNFYPQASSQWDSLGHVGYAPDVFYNGATESDVAEGRRNTIEHWSRKGIAGRAVLLDLVRSRSSAGRPYDPGSSTAFDVADLEAARLEAGVEFENGDVLLVHTGFAEWYGNQDDDTRVRLPYRLQAPGLARTEEMCAYLWDHRVCAVATDTFAVEVWPPSSDPADGALGFIHRILIGQFGMALGELWWLADLARDCAEDGVHQMFLVSVPLHAPGGIGSPPNAVAIK